jgi:uncharacterized protein YfiM (DUF2279 family)
MVRTGVPAGRLPGLALAGLFAAGLPAAGSAAEAPVPAAVAAPAARSGLLLPRAAEGPWLRSDRALHFGVCLAMAASFRVAGRDRGTAFGLSFGVGVGKEIADATLKPAGAGPRGMSRRDLVADLLGAAAGVLLLDAIDR